MPLIFCSVGQGKCVFLTGSNIPKPWACFQALNFNCLTFYYANGQTHNFKLGQKYEYFQILRPASSGPRDKAPTIGDFQRLSNDLSEI